jgi:VWFA-related protein
MFLFAVSGYAIGQTDKPDETVRIDTNLIQADVTVVDKSGKTVAGLTADQFQLKVAGKPVKIDFFDQVTTSNPVTTFTENKDASNPAADPAKNANPLRERKVVYFVDDYHLSLDSLNRTRLAVTHFIDNDMLPEDQVLILSASGNLGFLQQFTSNKAVLRAAIAKLRVYPNTDRDTDTQPPMPEYVAVRILNNDMQAAEFYIEKLQKGFQKNSLEKAAALDMIKQRANQIVYSMANSTKATLSSVENVLLTTGQLKGRKLIFLFSDGFYLEDKQTTYTTTNGLQRAINLATRSGSSIYTIDARGLFSMVGGDATGERPFDPQGRLDKGRIGEEAASQEGLATLANMTGGQFLKNQNYFDKWIDRVIDETSTYYILAWTPEKDEHLSKKFRDVDVDVIGRPELTVRSQRGYLPNLQPLNEKDKDNRGKKLLPTRLSLNFLDVPNVGPVLSSSVQVAANELFYGEKKDQQAAIDVVGIIRDLDGKQVGDFKTGLTLNAPAAGTDAAAAQDVFYNSKNPLPPGTYQVQVAVREGKTGAAGSSAQWIEIPDLAKRQLTLSSLFIGGQAIGGAKDKAAQVQFSVDNHFERPIKLDFTSFVYNAARGENGNGDANLATRVEVIKANGQPLIDTNLRPLVTKGNSDMARIIVRGSIKQPEILPGDYLLRVTVADNIANTKAVQQVKFTVE